MNNDIPTFITDSIPSFTPDDTSCAPSDDASSFVQYNDSSSAPADDASCAPADDTSCAPADDETAPSAIRLFGLVDDSIVDGPGIRLTIFAQGCNHQCPGCHNPEAQSPTGGFETTTDSLWEKVEANPLLSGITLSGGEPFDQASALIELVRRAREKGLSVWAYSGYLYDELINGFPSTKASELLTLCHVLVDGPFVQELKSYDLRLRGSAHQRIIDVPASLVLGAVVLWERAT
jgi:anaerobic ribonucleoside-triphosphate reductase activating protein